MAIHRQVSPTKRAKMSPARLGVDGGFSTTWLPRPPAYPSSGQLDVPRNATGINEYFHVLSLRYPNAVKCVRGWVIHMTPVSCACAAAHLSTNGAPHALGFCCWLLACVSF